jgi:hypothetical protein
MHIHFVYRPDFMPEAADKTCELNFKEKASGLQNFWAAGGRRGRQDICEGPWSLAQKAVAYETDRLPMDITRYIIRRTRQAGPDNADDVKAGLPRHGYIDS